jgi:hypothetical protein
MIKGVWGLIILIAVTGISVAVPVAAEVELPPWSWSTYSGATTWHVTVSESGCGESFTKQLSVPIVFRGGTATMGNVGHGSDDGVFISGNILHMPAREVQDGEGMSQLSAYDILFTTDCSAFAGRYSWTYYGPGGPCSGSTELSGSGRSGCPAPSVAPEIPTVAPVSVVMRVKEINAARFDLDQDLDRRSQRDEIARQLALRKIGEAAANQQIADKTNRIKALDPMVEGAYAAILEKDPTNFWANWDMAEFRKSQGNPDEYYRYVNNALANRDIAESTAKTLRDEIMKKNGLPEWPSAGSSIFIQMLGKDGRTAMQSVYGAEIRTTDGGTSIMDDMMRLLLYSNRHQIIPTLVNQ